MKSPNSPAALFLSSVPPLLSIWTISLAFLCVLHQFLLFVFFCFFHLSCVYLCTWGVRELTLLFSHLQRQRNTKKVLHNSYHTLLSGLWPYSSPYMSGDRYAPPPPSLQPHSTPRQAAAGPPTLTHRHPIKTSRTTHSAGVQRKSSWLFLDFSAWMCCLSYCVSLMLI